MTGYRKMAVALLGLAALVGLAIGGLLEGGPLATGIGAVVGAFCAANIFEHRPTCQKDDR